MPVDVTDKYIRIRIKDPALFVAGSFRTVTISEKEGISSVMGKLKSDPNGSMVVQNYMFLKEKGWTEEKAKKWVEEHKKKDEKKSADDPLGNEKENPMYFNESELEKRCIPGTEMNFEERQEKEKLPKITGYAALFNVWTDIAGIFKEMIKPGAFTKTIKENDIRALFNHNPDLVLGRNKHAGTLRLTEDEKGLRYEIDPPQTTWAKDIIESLRRKDVSQSSFQFRVNKQETDYEKDSRVLLDVTLTDISVVTFPAYPTTTAQVRSAFLEKKEKPPVPPPDPSSSPGLDVVTDKMKLGEKLSEEEQRFILAYLPDLSVPPAKHPETPPEPPAKHSADDPRKGKDKVSQLLIRAEKIAPATPS